MTMSSLLIGSPLAVLLAALLSTSNTGLRPGRLPQIAEYAAGTALLLAIGGLIQLIISGPITLMAVDGLIGLRLDAISATMGVLVSFVGWVVVRYSRFYLDGEDREGAFHGWLLTALGSVLVLVQGATLPVIAISFIAIGIAIRQLLLFYAERPEARRAATKFALVWGLGDAALIGASLLLAFTYGTMELSGLKVAVASGLTLEGHIAVALLVITAALKTASFPLHGWLTEVMEAPTPVSALLHAGIINSGGVLLIANASLIEASTGMMAALVMLGGFTALFGGIVMLTQSTVKTSLAWSTVAQMGFMLLQCGLGLWPLALLHIVAHSLYKAHAFLASGGAIAAVFEARKPGAIAVPNFAAVARSFGLALVMYVGVATAFGIIDGPASPQALALGAILIFGVAYLVAQGLADTAPKALTMRTVRASFGAAIAYFTFHTIAEHLWGPSLPLAPDLGPLEWALIALAVTSFGFVAVAQALFPLWAHHPATAGLRVHIANGLYLNGLLDRAIGGLKASKAPQI
ncbi:MAG: proton-conducting transporter membrane subunit [Pseudomonadota bacterium]